MLHSYFLPFLNDFKMDPYDNKYFEFKQVFIDQFVVKKSEVWLIDLRAYNATEISKCQTPDFCFYMCYYF